MILIKGTFYNILTVIKCRVAVWIFDGNMVMM